MKILIKLLIYLLICGSSLQAQNLDSLLTAYAQDGKTNGIRANFNGIVLVAKDNQIVFNKAYGYSNFEAKTKLTNDSQFLVGSVTKPIVAFLIMKQVEKGTIKLNQPITDFLPYMNEKKGKRLTIHGLLSHTSGVSHYSGISPFFKNRDDFFNAEMTPKEYALLIDKAGLESISGKAFNYSSLGYVLLGAVLEEVTGESFSDLIIEYISKPLQLNAIGFKDNEYLKTNIVNSYSFRNGAYKLAPNRNQSNTYTAGGVHANAQDLFTLTQALKSNKLLPKSLTNKVFEPNLQGYGYGWIRNDSEVLRYIPNAQFYAHGGRVNGYSSYVMLNDDGTTIIILSNTLPLQPWKLVSDIYRCYKNEDLQVSTRVIIPSLRSFERFNEEGGIDAFIKYKETLSKSAGYPIYPSSNYLARFVKMYHSNFKVEEMNSLMEKMIVGNPNAEDLINRLAYGYMEIDSSIAETYFKKGIELFPNSPNTWDSLGEYYEGKKDIPNAKNAYVMAVKLADLHNLKNLKLFKENLKRVEK